MDFFDVLLRVIALFGAAAACVGIVAFVSVLVTLARAVIRDIRNGRI